MRLSRAQWSLLALLVLVGGCVTAPPPIEPTPEEPEASDSGADPEPPVGTQTQPSPPPRPAPQPITLMAVGDMMIGTDFPDNRLPDDDGAGFLAGVESLLQSADISVGNLEGVLLDGGEPAKKCSNPAACYLFRSPTRYAQHFAAAGFDALSLANNHARDFGEEGRSASMAALDDVGIQHSGREQTTAEWQHGTTRIGFVAFAVTRESNPMLEVDLASAMVYDLAERNDIVIVSFHGGAEGLDALRLPFGEETYYDEPRGDVVRFSRSMIDAGADIVLGHGPHVVRATELYRQRLVAYSLGNFATYYGISVAGLKGVAPILEVRLSGEGILEAAQIHSTQQIRPAGPTFDPKQRALEWIARLNRQDFGLTALRFDANGNLLLPSAATHVSVSAGPSQ